MADGPFERVDSRFDGIERKLDRKFEEYARKFEEYDRRSEGYRRLKEREALAQLFGITGLPATMLLGGLCALAVLPFRGPLGKLNDRTMRWLLTEPESKQTRIAERV